jgi:hypothetical protein
VIASWAATIELASSATSHFFHAFDTRSGL